MPVEIASFVSQLNSTYPGGAEAKSDGDNHLRLIKAVLVATFANVAGAVTLTHTQINNAANFTGGNVTGMLFYQASCPTGWSAVAQNDKALRVVTNGTTGGSQGGTVAFSAIGAQNVASYALVEADIPSHTHLFALDSAGARADVGGGPAYSIFNGGNNTATSAYGGGGGHVHGVGFQPAYADTIICTKD